MTTNKIILGDCIEIMKTQIEKNSIQLIFADPPYNLSGNGLEWKGNKTGGDWKMVNENWDKMSQKDYLIFTHEWVKTAVERLTDNGSIYVACSYHNIAEVTMALKILGMKINNVITWYKTNAMPNMTKRVFTHSTEFVVWAVKGKNWIFNYETIKQINPELQKNGEKKQMRDMWQMPLVQGKERIRDEKNKAAHPTQKPEELLKRVILASSNEGDTVLDPFLGSGTTAFVAQKFNRNYIGIEKSEKYFSISQKRLLTLQNQF